MRILSISGSLRNVSSNTALLQAAAKVAPPGVEIELYNGLGNLPPFNPDIENAPPPSVVDFSSRIKNSAGVLISSPEYAHGVPGVLKNALDWVVGSGEFVYKPVALFNASPQSTFAQRSLTETLSVMTAHIVKEACVTFPLPGKKLHADGIAAHAEIGRDLRAALAIFVRGIETNPNKLP